jgi:hypothetical protein
MKFTSLLSRYSNVPVSKFALVTPVTNAKEYTDKKSSGNDTYLLLEVMAVY